jgi:amino acid adenylation domain-containing protein
MNKDGNDLSRDDLAGALPRRIEQQARIRPEAIAIRAGNQTLTYAALNEAANRLAWRLRELGVGADVLTGLCLESGPDLIVALLAILKSGGAYVPLDPDYPPERVRRVLARAKPRFLVTRQHWLDVLSPDDMQVVCVDRDRKTIRRQSAENLPGPITADSLCYVMFTSGSTGQPKGVMVTHGNIAGLFDYIGPHLGIGPEDVWSQLHSCAFGFSVFEIFGALAHGGCLAFAPAVVRADSQALRAFLQSAGVTVLSQTPSAFRQTLLNDAFNGAWATLRVRTVVLSGEPVIADDLLQWSERHGATAPRLVNTYAITETGGNVTLREYPALMTGADARNIGRPLPGVAVQILDGAHGPVPPGEVGELYVGGPGIARGYLDDPALTASRFVTLPGRALRWYRTGDLVCATAAGELEFIGRADDQVKWRGFRLELGEIESLLRTHPGISAAAAAIREDGAGQEKLVAYVVRDARQDGEAMSKLSDQCEFWPSLGAYQVYDELLYELMSNDPLRNAAFRAAFVPSVRGRIVLDLGTGPEALLARLCVEAGARQVYAVEVLPDAAGRARARLRALGLDDRIMLIEGDAAQANLPGPADVCTQGIIGNIGSADGIAAIWNRVRRHFAPGCIPVPLRCTTHIAAVELPDALCETPAFSPVARNYVDRIFAAEGREFDVRLCVRNIPPAQLISEAQIFEDLDFRGALPESGQGDAVFRMTRPARFDGFLLWTVVTTAEGVCIDYLQHQHAWLPVFFPLPDGGVKLPADAEISASWEWAPAEGSIFPDYRVRATYVDQDAGVPRTSTLISRHHETAFGATDIHRRLLAPDASVTAGVAPRALRTWLARHLPEPLLPNAWMYLEALPVSPNGKLDRQALPAPARGWGGHGGAPQSALESDLASLWSEILGVAAVGVQDNFFDLGGDSIAAVRLTTRLQQLLDDGVMLAAVFEAPTIGALARHLEQQHAAAVAARYGSRREPAPRRRTRKKKSFRTHGEI